MWRERYLYFWGWGVECRFSTARIIQEKWLKNNRIKGISNSWIRERWYIEFQRNTYKFRLREEDQEKKQNFKHKRKEGLQELRESGLGWELSSEEQITRKKQQYCEFPNSFPIIFNSFKLSRTKFIFLSSEMCNHRYYNSHLSPSFSNITNQFCNSGFIHIQKRLQVLRLKPSIPSKDFN